MKYYNIDSFIANLKKYKTEIERNNRRHGFYKYSRTYGDFIRNLLGEIQEVSEQMQRDDFTKVYNGKILNSNSKVSELVNHYKYDRNYKPEGAPTEFADIIIFILDYI